VNMLSFIRDSYKLHFRKEVQINSKADFPDPYPTKTGEKSCFLLRFPPKHSLRAKRDNPRNHEHHGRRLRSLNIANMILLKVINYKIDLKIKIKM